MVRNPSTELPLTPNESAFNTFHHVDQCCYQKVIDLIIFSKGFGPSMRDLDPVLDKGSSASSGGIQAAQRLREVLDTNFEPEPARQNYRKGWGHHMLDARAIVCSWTITVQDLTETLVSIPFDLTIGDAPLTVDLDLQQYSHQSFNSPHPTITFSQSGDKVSKLLPVYSQGGRLTKRARKDFIAITVQVDHCQIRHPVQSWDRRHWLNGSTATPTPQKQRCLKFFAVLDEIAILHTTYATKSLNCVRCVNI